MRGKIWDGMGVTVSVVVGVRVRAPVFPRMWVRVSVLDSVGFTLMFRVKVRVTVGDDVKVKV